MQWKVWILFPEQLKIHKWEPMETKKKLVLDFRDRNGRFDKTTAAIVIAAAAYVFRRHSFQLIPISTLYTWRNAVLKRNFWSSRTNSRAILKNPSVLPGKRSKSWQSGLITRTSRSWSLCQRFDTALRHIFFSVAKGKIYKNLTLRILLVLHSLPSGDRNTKLNICFWLLFQWCSSNIIYSMFTS